MASGTLGQVAPLASANTSGYTVPAGKTASFTVNFCNRGTSPVLVRLAIAAALAPANAEYIEYDAVIPANGVLERTGLAATAGKQVVVYADTANVSVNIFGFEE